MLENPFAKILVKKAAGDFVPFTSESVKDPYNLHWVQDVGNWIRDFDQHVNDYALESAPLAMDWWARIPYLKHLTQYTSAAAAPILNMVQGRGPFSNWSNKDVYTDKAESDRKQAIDALYNSSASGWSDSAADKWKWDYTTMLDPRFKSVKDIVSILDNDPNYKAALETVAKTGNLDDLRGYYTKSGKPNAIENIWGSDYSIGDNAQGNAQLLLNLYNSAKAPKKAAPASTPPVEVPSAPTGVEGTSMATVTPINTGSTITLSNADPFAEVRNPLNTAENRIGKDIGYTYKKLELPEFVDEAIPWSKSTDVKNPFISIEQARGLLAKGIAPTSIGGYSQTLGADGTNSLAQQELELMDKDPTYNPFANTQAKYVQNLNKMRLLDQYNPENIMAENQRIRQNQAKLDADRRSRMDAAKYYAGQGVQGAYDYHNYMMRGGQLSQAGQQWRDNFDVTGWNQQQQANKTKFRAQQPTTNPVQVQAPLGVGPRPVAEQASMRKALGHADTGVGVGSHAAAAAYNAASNKANGLTTATGAKTYTNPNVTRTKTAFVKNPFTNTK